MSCAGSPWRGPRSASRLSTTAGGCWRSSRASSWPSGFRASSRASWRTMAWRSTSQRGPGAAHRRGRPADLQPRRRRSPVPVRQRPPGEGPAAGRRGARGLCRHAGARSPCGAGAVPRASARGSRRQRPPGQDRSALPRSGLRARLHRRRAAPCARQAGRRQRADARGRGDGHVAGRAAGSPPPRRWPRCSPANMRAPQPAARGGQGVARLRGGDPRPRSPRRSGRSAIRRGDALPARRRARAGGGHLYRRRGRRRAGDRRPARRA